MAKDAAVFQEGSMSLDPSADNCIGEEKEILNLMSLVSSYLMFLYI